MSLITGVTLPDNGDRIKVSDYNDPIQKLLTTINGGLDDSNITGISGTKINAGTVPSTALDANFNIQASQGWNTITQLPTVVNSGQREHILTFPGVNLTNVISHATRFRGTRATAPATQCMSFTRTSSQYATRATGSVVNVAFTDDFTVEAWVKLASYPTSGSAYDIMSRLGAASGWRFWVSDTGQISIAGYNGGYVNNRQLAASQSLPLNKWVHVAATLDMSGYTTTTSKVIIDGVDVPAVLSTGGTNPTSLVQQGPLNIGAYNDVINFFDGQIAEVRVWSTLRTTQQIIDNMNQTVAAGTSGLNLYYAGNGNFNDGSGNGNNLTATNGASAVFADAPFKASDYAIATSLPVYNGTNTTVTVFTPSEYPLTSGGYSAFSYSNLGKPFGLPANKSRWQVETIIRANLFATITTSTNWVPFNVNVLLPTGAWRYGIRGNFASESASGTQSSWVTLASAAPLNNAQSITSGSGDFPIVRMLNTAASSALHVTADAFADTVVSTPTRFNAYATSDTVNAGQVVRLRADQGVVRLYAENQYF